MLIAHLCFTLEGDKIDLSDLCLFCSNLFRICIPAIKYKYHKIIIIIIKKKNMKMKNGQKKKKKRKRKKGNAAPQQHNYNNKFKGNCNK